MDLLGGAGEDGSLQEFQIFAKSSRDKHEEFGEGHNYENIYSCGVPWLICT